MTEVIKGTGSNKYGEVSRVVSEYDLEGAVLVDVVDADIVEYDGDRLVVSTEYVDSVSFKVVVIEDERRAVYVFAHVRDVVKDAGRVPNHVEPAVRPDGPDIVESPVVREVNVR